jgi:integrating conjugative element protein (TIGR03755 family)
VVSEVTKAGFNLLNNRSAADTSTIAPNDCNSGMLCGTWRSPDEAAAFANRVLGEVQQQTCETCTKSTTTAGVGLTPLIQEEYEAKLEALHELISGSKPPSTENLNLAGTRGVITALRDEPDQEILAQRLASEIAVTSVLEKALLLQRALLAGNKEPNVAANEIATVAVNTERQSLQQEITNLKTELELRRSPSSLLGGLKTSKPSGSMLPRHRGTLKSEDLYWPLGNWHSAATPQLTRRQGLDQPEADGSSGPCQVACSKDLDI